MPTKAALLVPPLILACAPLGVSGAFGVGSSIAAAPRHRRCCVVGIGGPAAAAAAAAFRPLRNDNDGGDSSEAVETTGDDASRRLRHRYFLRTSGFSSVNDDSEADAAAVQYEADARRVLEERIKAGRTRPKTDDDVVKGEGDCDRLIDPTYTEPALRSEWQRRTEAQYKASERASNKAEERRAIWERYKREGFPTHRRKERDPDAPRFGDSLRPRPEPTASVASEVPATQKSVDAPVAEPGSVAEFLLEAKKKREAGAVTAIEATEKAAEERVLGDEEPSLEIEPESKSTVPREEAAEGRETREEALIAEVLEEEDALAEKATVRPKQSEDIAQLKETSEDEVEKIAKSEERSPDIEDKENPEAGGDTQGALEKLMATIMPSKDKKDQTEEKATGSSDEPTPSTTTEAAAEDFAVTDGVGDDDGEDSTNDDTSGDPIPFATTETEASLKEAKSEQQAVVDEGNREGNSSLTTETEVTPTAADNGPSDAAEVLEGKLEEVVIDEAQMEGTEYDMAEAIAAHKASLPPYVGDFFASASIKAALDREKKLIADKVNADKES